ncbi:MAG: cell division protein FtsL [Mariprofundaceae bacterium]|nr:cell division protein FtsL [Mariprofundaceae bacterium]
MNTSTRRVRPWLLVVLVASVLAIMQVGIAHQRLQVVAQQSVLQRDVRQLEDEISRMNIELATLTRPDRLRRVAANELGMRPPAAMQVVHW